MILLLSAAESWTFTSLRPPLHHEVSTRLVPRPEALGPRMHRNETSEATFPNLVRFSFELAKTLLTLLAGAAIYFGFRLQQMLKTSHLDQLSPMPAVNDS